MALPFNRYESQMLVALSQQSLASIAIHAVVRAVIINLAIQLITFLSGLTVSSLVQALVLIFIFSVLLFSFDVIEKYWAQKRLQKR